MPLFFFSLSPSSRCFRSPKGVLYVDRFQRALLPRQTTCATRTHSIDPHHLPHKHFWLFCGFHSQFYRVWIKTSPWRCNLTRVHWKIEKRFEGDWHPMRCLTNIPHYPICNKRPVWMGKIQADYFPNEPRMYI